MRTRCSWPIRCAILVALLLLSMVLVAPALADSGSGAGTPSPNEPDPGTEDMTGGGDEGAAMLEALLRAAGQFV